MGEKRRTSNRDVPWDEFDPDAYVSHYYSDPHPDDDQAVQLASLALSAAKPAGNQLSVVDVGTGPNLFPLLAALPRSARLTAWEYSDANLRWLTDELARPALREPWVHFWSIVRKAYGAPYHLPEDPMPVLCARTRVQKGSVYDLPERQWDAATMFFCAESITDQFEEFQLACSRFAKCVRSGGTLTAAFLLSSEAYVVAGHRYPVLKLSEALLSTVFRSVADNVVIQTIGAADDEVRSGYVKMAFLTARSL